MRGENHYGRWGIALCSWIIGLPKVAFSSADTGHIRTRGKLSVATDVPVGKELARTTRPRVANRLLNHFPLQRYSNHSRQRSGVHKSGRATGIRMNINKVLYQEFPH